MYEVPNPCLDCPAVQNAKERLNNLCTSSRSIKPFGHLGIIGLRAMFRNRRQGRMHLYLTRTAVEVGLGSGLNLNCSFTFDIFYSI